METINLLNELTANLGVFYIKLHQHHFYVKGHHFFELHRLFEDLYNEVHEHLDGVAERILMLEGQPVSSLTEFLALAEIKESAYTQTKTEDEMVLETVQDFELLVNLLVKGIQSPSIDEVTQDMLISIKASYDKHVWMLKAFLGK